MVKELHVIVHEESVNAYASIGSQQANRVKKIIGEIKKNNNYINIIRAMNPLFVHPSMPQPNGVQILVSGAQKGQCVALQVYALRKKGYDAVFNDQACYDNLDRFPDSALPEDFRDVVPEYDSL